MSTDHTQMSRVFEMFANNPQDTTPRTFVADIEPRDALGSPASWSARADEQAIVLARVFRSQDEVAEHWSTISTKTGYLAETRLRRAVAPLTLAAADVETIAYDGGALWQRLIGYEPAAAEWLNRRLIANGRRAALMAIPGDDTALGLASRVELLEQRETASLKIIEINVAKGLQAPSAGAPGEPSRLAKYGPLIALTAAIVKCAVDIIRG